MIGFICYAIICIIDIFIIWKYSKIEYYCYVVDITSTFSLGLAYILAFLPFINIVLLCILLVGIIETKCLKY